MHLAGISRNLLPNGKHEGADHDTVVCLPEREFSMDQFVKELQALMTGQRLAVLATNSDGQSHLSLVAFVISEKDQSIFFVTPRTTRKFEYLSADPRVAMLVHNAANQSSDIYAASAVTIYGKAEPVDGQNKEKALQRYLEQHPYMESFARSPSSELIRIVPESFSMVKKFQEVEEYFPK